MKNRLIKALSVATLLSFATIGASCGISDADKQAIIDAAKDGIIEEAKDGIITEAIESTKVVVSTQPAEGTTIAISSPAENDKYLPGTEISFEVTVDEDWYLLTGIYAGNSYLGASAGTYKTIVPSTGLVIKTEAEKLADASAFEVKDVNVETLPTNGVEVRDILLASQEIDGKYFSSAEFTDTTGYFTNSNTFADLNGRIVADKNGSVIKEYAGINNETQYTGKSTHYKMQSSIVDGYFAQIETSDGLYDPISSASNSQKYLRAWNKVVADDAETVLKTQITESEATKKTTSGLVPSTLVSKFFYEEGTSNNSSFTSTGEDYYAWQVYPEGASEKTFDVKVAEDNKSYTVTIKMFKKGYSGLDTYEFVGVIDGNNFLRSASYINRNYTTEQMGSEKIDEVTYYYPLDVDTYNVEKKFSITQYAGAKKATGLTEDLSAFAASDFKVNTFYKLPEDTSYVACTDGRLFVGSLLKFSMNVKDFGTVLVYPYISKATEGFITETDNGPQVSAEGEFTLTFTNGFGVEKAYTFTSTKPDPKSVYVTGLGNKVFTSSETTFTAGIKPDGAVQTVTAAITEGNDLATLATNEDGTFTLTVGETKGTVKITLTSTVLETVSSVISVDIIEKPTKEAVLEVLTSKSIKANNSSSYTTFIINFNEDGTVKVGEEWYGAPTTLNYTVDEDLNFVITPADDFDESASSYYKLTEFYAYSTEDFALSIDYKYYGSVKVINTFNSISVVNRIELK